MGLPDEMRTTLGSGSPERTPAVTPSASPADASVFKRPLEDLLPEATAFHGHLCPGVVLGTRMVIVGCRAIGLDQPRAAGKDLVVLVEIDRCATDAIQAVTGASLGKRTLKHLDYGKMAATFVSVPRDAAVRVAVREESRWLARSWAPGESDARKAQTAAYRVMPEADLFKVERVVVDPGWLDRRRVRVLCEACGEGVNYRRELSVGGRTLCRSCAGESYYARLA
jgi:formylmethanofuran dehydrogenase subunit E